ncbi:molybdopterin-dependent oxidoreductase [Roseiterribacter gracilis]|uniref:Oxidase n=1 Tax=Roseiterribacter gracilis TaxID=2812848 RepID=A0A8S8XCR2_9PROT|nr:oxidase [Rhodospirillales bacterium TMPK1]
MDVTRRDLLRASSQSALLSMLPVAALAAPTFEDALPDGVRDGATLEALPGKKPLIKLSYRPPNYETPINYFDQLWTPNDAFFVRYHLAVIPEVDAKEWRLKIGGDGATTPFELTLDQLTKQFEQVEIPAVCMCSGNRRGLFQPHVPGVQWGHGAIGNAKWKGVRLKDVLAKAGVKKEAIELRMDGADSAPLDKTPDFVKSIPLWKALDDSVLIATHMNGQPLPHWNGYPARIIVPGWTATYWMKHITSLELLTKPLDNFWMKTAYRIPQGKFPVVQRFLGQETEINAPITEMLVNSLLTNITNGQKVKVGQQVEIRGMAWDGGYGIRTVEISSDGGTTWTPATLADDPGRFSFRPFNFRFQPKTSGKVVIVARATNKLGQTQTTELIPNPSGYHHNVMHRVTLDVG